MPTDGQPWRLAQTRSTAALRASARVVEQLRLPGRSVAAAPPWIALGAAALALGLGRIRHRRGR